MSTLKETSHMVGLLTFVVACIIAGCTLGMCLSCGTSPPPVAEVTPAAAGAAYTAELLRCTKKSATLAASLACEAEVDRRWGVDAGKDGDK
jgi:hypothetical protein